MATPQQSGTLFNALTSGSKIIGTIIADADIRIDGVVEGDVQCAGKVVIGERGRLKGTIHCQGTIEGKREVKQTLALRATSNLQGEAKTQVLIVEPNAVFNGTCSMEKNANPAAAKK